MVCPLFYIRNKKLIVCFLYTYVLIIQSSFVFFPKHLYLSLVIFRKVFVPLSLERSMPLWYAIVRFLGPVGNCSEFLNSRREDACTSMTSHRVRAVCPCLKGSRYYLLFAGLWQLRTLL